MTKLNTVIKKGVSWSFVNQGYNLLSQFTLGIWLARILGPEAYGTVAMVTVFSAFAQMFVDFGFSAALVQKQEVSDIDYSTIFWFNLLVGISLCTMFYFSSGLIAEFYKKQELVVYTKVISLQFILSSLALTQSVQLTKKIDFKTKTLISILSSLVSFILAIILAKKSLGVWAIIAQMLSSRLINICLLYYFVSWKPKFVFSRNSFKSVYKFGFSVTGNSILNFAARNTDNLLIGKYLGDSNLGVYSKSYSFILFPIRNFSNVIKQVLFPSFSMVQNNVQVIKDYYLKITSLIIYLLFPIMLLLSLSAKEIVLLLFGKAWIEMVPLIEIFSILGMFQSILTLNGTVYMSLGKAYLALKVGVFSKLVTLLCIIYGVYSGKLINIAYSLVVAQLINFYPVFYSSIRLINLSIYHFFKYNLKIFLVLVLSLAFTYLINFIEISNMLILISMKCTSFLMFYILFSLIFKLNEFRFLLSKLHTVFRK